MKLDLSLPALGVLGALTPIQRDAVRILHIRQPTRAVSSGVPRSTFKALQRRDVARPASPDETSWLLTELGLAVQAALALDES